MPTVQILKELASLPYFTIEGYKQIASINNESTQTARIQLARWHKAGHILRLKRGMYMTRSFYDRHSSDADFPATVSAILLPQSYVSTNFVLQRAGILTEATFPITAITMKNTRTITNDIGTYSYQHVDGRYYHGFSQYAYQGITFFQASPVKALFDYLYLRPLSSIERRLSYNLAEELRLNLTLFPYEARVSFEELVAQSDSPKMRDILKNFQRHVWQT
jgi:predicted transcriptional regulator of viral defense system